MEPISDVSLFRPDGSAVRLSEVIRTRTLLIVLRHLA